MNTESEDEQCWWRYNNTKFGYAKEWMVVLDGKVAYVISPSEGSLVNALATLFASYYAFNYEYQEEAATTLEFIQRCLKRINPESGTKCTTNRTSKKTANLSKEKEK
ncbi:uncharacterized protein LOC117107658 isoform X2 [Anneissia japonica]|uniref:uncharacterized protein LOC117107658 isoform X2 n=1 Tax=Anneissia japonica TaxID=1529436 RepID=UPI00142599FC|nr:uncharacterized protein LOC117107658 isoform X2 [Anneissia japonica]